MRDRNQIKSLTFKSEKTKVKLNGLMMIFEMDPMEKETRKYFNKRVRNIV
jgi:uncharacterized pyridoxal phosphate-containing UPF0001 family protein